MPHVGHPWRKHLFDAQFIVMEVDTSVMIILVMSWNTSTTAQVWLSWFCHKIVVDVHAWQKRDLLWQTRIIMEVYFFGSASPTFLHGLSERNMLNSFDMLIYAPTTQKIICSFELSLFSYIPAFIYQLIVRSSCAFVLSMLITLVVRQSVLFRND